MASAANSLPEDQPQRVQLSLLPDESEPNGDEQRAAVGLPPLQEPEWEHTTLLEAMKAKGGRGKRKAKKPSPEEVAEALEQMRGAKASASDRKALTEEEAAALMQKRGCDRARIAGILRIRQEGDLPEGFRHWGIHAEKLIPCDAIPWTCASGRVEWQLNPDTPPIDENGRPMKYLFRKGCGGLVGVLPGSESTVLDADVPLLIVEGTYQGRAVATALEGSSNPFAVVQVSGCDGWMTGGAPSPEFGHIPLRGREVFFLPDADVKTNRGVYDAARYLRENLLDEYLARDVRIIHLPGRGNDGADDVLSRHAQDHNQEMVLLWIEKARGKDGQLSAKPPRKPRRNSGFFTEQGQFQPVDFWRYLEQKHHLALNGDKAIALYEGGVYKNSDSRRWNRAVEEALGNDFVPQYLNTVNEIAHSSLKVSGKEVPTFLAEPLLNVANGLVNLRTGKLQEHSPEVVTTTQLPIEWDPAAKCPTWEALIESALPGQIERLEDVMSQALDWTRAPVKILLLYGASRAGKGLILRVLEQIMGRGNYSAVTLHQLSDDRFMVAELYGKRANIAGELKPEEVRDISAVKMLTGEDPIQANKKYGATFTFYSYAFLAFSCNKLPPINETTKAFTSRVAPFHFTVGHDGREDLTLAAKLRAELPGILVRLVKAWQRREERGGFLPVDAATALHFGQNIDHVARFLAERTAPVEKLTDGLKRPELFQLWQQWCAEENLTLAARTSRNTFFEKVRNQGVRDGKDARGTFRWWVKASDNELEDGNPSTIHGNSPNGNGNTTNGNTAGNGTPKPPRNGKETAVNGNGSGKTAVGKTKATTGKSAPERQLRQFPAETSKTSETTPSLTTAVNHIHTERYGKGCLKTAVIAVPPPPADELVPAGCTGPLVVDLETCSADQLWSRPDFIRLVGTDHGNSTDPSALLRHTGPLVAHNGFGFDFLALAHHHGMPLLELSEQDRLIDTMVLETLAHPNRQDLKPEQYIRQLGLDAAAERRGLPGKTDDLGKLARTAAKAAGITGSPKQLEAAGYGLIPPGDQAYNAYLRGDVAAGRAVFQSQCPGGQLTPYQQREMRLMGRLAHGITLVGFRIDRPEVERREADKQQRVADGVTRLQAIGLPERTQDKHGKWSAPHATAAGKAAIAAAFADLGITLPLTATGQPQIKADTLKELAAANTDNTQVVALCETVAGLVGARSSMGNLLSYATGDRVHPLVFPGQATGRCSITKPGLTVFGKHGANAAEREVFLPDADDHLLLAIDLSKADARAVAVWSQDPGYLDLFDAGVDINKALAEQFGIPKTLAKALGHGTRYNQQARGMHNQTGIALEECERFLEGHHRRHAAVHRWINRVVAIAERDQPLHNGFGRLLYTGRHTTGPRKGESKAFTQAPAYLGQSTTREWMAEGILRLPLEIAKQIRAFLHDEVVLSVPERHLDLYREALLEAFQFSWAPPAEAMVIPGSCAIRPVPVVAELSAPGRTWADCYRGET